MTASMRSRATCFFVELVGDEVRVVAPAADQVGRRKSHIG